MSQLENKDALPLCEWCKFEESKYYASFLTPKKAFQLFLCGVECYTEIREALYLQRPRRVTSNLTLINKKELMALR